MLYNDRPGVSYGGAVDELSPHGLFAAQYVQEGAGPGRREKRSPGRWKNRFWIGPPV